MTPSRWRGQCGRSRAIQQVRGGALLLARDLVNQMRAGHASTERFSIPQPARVRGPGTSSQDGISGKLHRSPRRPARGSAKRSELRSDASWQVHRPADGVDRSGHGTKDFLRVLRASRARSGVGAEPAPAGPVRRPRRGLLLLGARGLSRQISGDAMSITRTDSQSTVKSMQQQRSKAFA